MHALDSIEGPEELHLLVAFFDLTRFAPYAQGRENVELFNTLADYYVFVGDIVENSGGKVVKFIGDAGLVVYTEDRAESGVLALAELKRAGDAWLEAHGSPCRHVVKVHFGPVTCGLVGTRTDQRFDVLGTAVNTAATLRSNGFAMSAQAFRKLGKETRRLFKKHTPAITYIPVEEPHRG